MSALASEETLSAVGNGHRAAEAGEVGHVEELAHGTGRTAGHLRAVHALVLGRAGVDEHVEVVVAERAGAAHVHVVVAGVVALVASSGGLADVAIRHCRAKHDFTQEGRINEIAGLAHCTLASEETSSAVGNGHRAAEAGKVGHVEELAHGT